MLIYSIIFSNINKASVCMFNYYLTYMIKPKRWNTHITSIKHINMQYIVLKQSIKGGK